MLFIALFTNLSFSFHFLFLHSISSVYRFFFCFKFAFDSFCVDKFVLAVCVLVHFVSGSSEMSAVAIVCNAVALVHLLDPNIYSIAFRCCDFKWFFCFSPLQIDKHLCWTFSLSHLTWCDFMLQMHFYIDRFQWNFEFLLSLQYIADMRMIHSCRPKNFYHCNSFKIISQYL